MVEVCSDHFSDKVIELVEAAGLYAERHRNDFAVTIFIDGNLVLRQEVDKELPVIVLAMDNLLTSLVDFFDD